MLVEFIFGSQIIAQFWNKVLTLHNMDWTVIRGNVKHRFCSIVFPIDDMLKYYYLIYEFVMEYEKVHGIVESYKRKRAWYTNQFRIFKQQHQTRRSQKHSATKPVIQSSVAQEATRLLCTTAPQEPAKPVFFQDV